MEGDESMRYCRCGTRLARDNPAVLCLPCQRDAHNELLQPPTVPPDFWETDQMRDTLASRHLGLVIRSYRMHPHHGARALSQELVAGWGGLTQAQLSRIESGKPVRDLDRLTRWAQLLQIPQTYLWFDVPQSNQAPVATLPMPTLVGTQPDHTRGEHVQRRNFIGLGAAVTAGSTAVAELLAALQPAAAPTVVTTEDVEQVRHAAQLFTSWDHTYGGGIVRETVIAQLRWSAQLLKADCPPSLHAELFRNVGYLSGVSGFMAFDAYAHDEARHIFTFGLSCAEEVGAWHLRAKLLSSLARQAIWCGDPDSGLTYAELALVRADRLTATERAMLHTARARALGKLGRVQETLQAVGAADEAFAHAKTSEEPWMAYYDHAQHHGDTGHALFDLAMKGARTEAAARLAIAVDGHAEHYVRSRAISGTKLATLVMATGDPMEAVAIGNRALGDAGPLRSQRTKTDMRELRRTAARHESVPAVAELGERIGTLVRSR